jgi:hypothetical protein
MYEQPSEPAADSVEIYLDGRPVRLPAERRSISAIRTYLETLAMANQRILCALSVDGRPAKITPSAAYPENASFSRVEGQSIDLADLPLRMLETALEETAQARSAAETAVTLVLINDSAAARELWFDVARKLKEPLLTLSLLPETIYQPAPGCASLTQMRKWQLQQLAIIMKDVDAAAWSSEPDALSTALETRALPWLDKLQQLIRLWHQTVLAGVRARSNWDRDVDQRTVAST